jgi:enoyl-CoA hydratase
VTDSLLCKHDGPIATVTINRPEQRNALNAEVLGALRVRLAELSVDSKTHVVVLRGEGAKSFCSGFDLEEMVSEKSDRSLLVSVFQEMFALGKPLIAAVQGNALAGGMGLAVACDFVVADDSAVFGLPEINVGLWPFVITIPLLYSLPPKVVLELMMTGRKVNAIEAQRLGIANRVVKSSELETELKALADELAAKPQQTMRIGRQSFYDVLEGSVSQNFDQLLVAFSSIVSTDDAQEGIAAFREKRSPRWAQ